MRVTSLSILIPMLFVLSTSAHSQCLDAPTAVDDAVMVPALSSSIDALANDTDPNGALLTITVTGTTCNGAATVEDGMIRLNLTAFPGTACTVSYRVSNGSLTDTATVTVSRRSGIFSDNWESGNLDLWT